MSKEIKDFIALIEKYADVPFAEEQKQTLEDLNLKALMRLRVLSEGVDLSQGKEWDFSKLSDVDWFKLKSHEHSMEWLLDVKKGVVHVRARETDESRQRFLEQEIANGLIQKMEEEEKKEEI